MPDTGIERPPVLPPVSGEMSADQINDLIDRINRLLLVLYENDIRLYNKVIGYHS